MTFQLDDGASEIYENVLVPLWFERWAAALIDTLSLRSGEHVLDVACGTGVTTRMAHDEVTPGGTVTGLDINASMIAKARQLAAGRDIDWRERDASDSGLRSGTVDAVLSQHGYHYFPDKPRALEEFRRVLTPGGRLALSIWAGHSPYTEAVCEAIEKHISPEIAQKQRSQRETPSADTLAEHLGTAGYSDVRIVTQDLSIDVPAARTFVPQHLCSMPIAGSFQELSEERKAALIDDVETAMSDYALNGRLVYPDAVRVAMGTR